MESYKEGWKYLYMVGLTCGWETFVQCSQGWLAGGNKQIVISRRKQINGSASCLWLHGYFASLMLDLLYIIIIVYYKRNWNSWFLLQYHPESSTISSNISMFIQSEYDLVEVKSLSIYFIINFFFFFQEKRIYTVFLIFIIPDFDKWVYSDHLIQFFF